MDGAHELTPEQAAVEAARGRHVRVHGGAGTGKTVALRARFLSLISEVGAASVVVLCRSHTEAARFLDAVVDHLGAGFGSLPVTTFVGLSLDLVRHAGDDARVLTGGEQRVEIGRLLGHDSDADWPTLGPVLRRPAFPDHVAAAIAFLDSSGLDDAEVVTRATAAGGGEAWAELCSFAGRLRTSLARRSLVGAAALTRRAVLLAEQPSYRHVLVDDYEAVTPVEAALVRALAAGGATVAVAGNPVGPRGRHGGPAALDELDLGSPVLDIELTRAWRLPESPRVVVCNHPSLEGEAVVGEVVAARAAGAAWSDVGVLTPTDGRRARAVVQSLRRHGMPVSAEAGAAADDHPVVQWILDVLQWTAAGVEAHDAVVTAQATAGTTDAASPSAGAASAATGGLGGGGCARPSTDLIRTAGGAGEAALELDALRERLAAMAPTAAPAELAFEVWAGALGHLGGDTDAGDTDALDAVTAFVHALQHRAEREPGERLAAFVSSMTAAETVVDGFPHPSVEGNRVTVTTIARAAGREWHTVVLAGCVEGELPRARSGSTVFDTNGLLARAPETSSQDSDGVVEERRRFGSACGRATTTLVGVAAPAPGVLVSRFVESWTTNDPRLHAPPTVPAGATRAGLTAPTVGSPPVFGDGRLRLSASQLATYDDCPLRYAYDYVLGGRQEAGVRAALGSLVHAVLADFLRPTPDGEAPVPRTRERLMAIADHHWRDDVALYRPQVEEVRRDYFAMLDAWWQAEGSQSGLSPTVLDVERRFEIDVGPHVLVGRIDRVDRADDGEGIRLVDYKTGRSKATAAQVAGDIQLAVYHLAATRDPNLVALGPPSQLRLLYLRDMKALEQDVTGDHAAATEARVLDTAAAILDERFEPSVDADCRTCSYHRLCPLQDSGRRVAGAAR